MSLAIVVFCLPLELMCFRSWVVAVELGALRGGQTSGTHGAGSSVEHSGRQHVSSRWPGFCEAGLAGPRAVQTFARDADTGVLGRAGMTGDPRDDLSKPGTLRA